VLTPLQLQILQILASLPDTEDLALAGGGALIVQGIIDRETRDVDFFSNAPEEVDRLLPSGLCSYVPSPPVVRAQIPIKCPIRCGLRT
jgi:hypothetical protein